MSESCREQHPLLHEGLSDEEQLSPRYQRFRPMVYKGRAGNKVKGAAAIFRLWPGHWSSSVTYWWLGLGMIGLLTFIVYNSIAVFTMLPPVHSSSQHRNVYNVKPTPVDTEFSFNVFMHLFIENNQEVDLNSYMPYIDIIANKYSDFKYHLIIIFNDSSLEKNVLSAEENNEMALNMLWPNNDVHNSQKNNIVIEYVTLSKYMDNSPLRKYWKKLPEQFTEFFIRAVSIWDKGGIAFNPILLTPKSPHAIYIEKIQNLLKSYHQNSKKIIMDQKIIRKQHNGKKKRVNNIRDIIDALESDKKFDDATLDYIKDKEFNNKFKQPPQDKDLTINNTGNYRKIHPKFSKLLKNISIADNIKSPDTGETLVMAESSVMSTAWKESNDTGKSGFLSMFIDFLFGNKPNLNTQSNMNDEQKIVTEKVKFVASDNTQVNKNTVGKYIEQYDKKGNRKLRSLIIPAEPIHKPEKINEDEMGNDDQFTIDLKGNIVATEIPCHAFLGTMFNDAVHRTEESLTDFIISELSIFCKGALSSCKGIDVILL